MGQGSFAKVPLDQVPLVKVPLGLHHFLLLSIQTMRDELPKMKKSQALSLIEYPAAAAVLYCWKWPQLGPVNKGEGGACYLAAAAIDPK